MQLVDHILGEADVDGRLTLASVHDPPFVIDMDQVFEDVIEDLRVDDRDFSKAPHRSSAPNGSPKVCTHIRPAR
jgi:hypothetical protein